MVTARLRGEMRLIILVRDELESEVENVYVAGENTGIGGVMANKVCCSFFYHGLLVEGECLYTYYAFIPPTLFNYIKHREG